MKQIEENWKENLTVLVTLSEKRCVARVVRRLLASLLVSFVRVAVAAAAAKHLVKEAPELGVDRRQKCEERNEVSHFG
jgi:hypothetical protein